MTKEKSERYKVAGFEDGNRGPQAKELKWPLEAEKARKCFSQSLQKETQSCQHLNTSLVRLV